MNKKMIANELVKIAKSLMAMDSTVFYRTKGGTKHKADSIREVPEDAVMIWNRTETFVGRLLNNGEWQLQTFTGYDPTVVQDFKDRFEVKFHSEASGGR